MALTFPSDEWIKALQVKINASPDYAEAAKTWEGDFYFYVEPDGGLKDTVVLYLDLWHGQCRDARLVNDETAKKPAYTIRASLSSWEKVVLGQLEPIQAIMTRKLRLEGDLVQVMRSVKAASELIRCCTQVETVFPA